MNFSQIVIASALVASFATPSLAGSISSRTTNTDIESGRNEWLQFDRTQKSNVNRTESGTFDSSAVGAKFESEFTGDGNGTDLKFNFAPLNGDASAWIPDGDTVIQFDASRASKYGDFQETSETSFVNREWGTADTYENVIRHEVEARTGY